VVLKGVVAARTGLPPVPRRRARAHVAAEARRDPDALKLALRRRDQRPHADPLQDGCWFELDSWVKPPVLCYGAPDGNRHRHDIAPQPAIDVTPYESREVMVTARDG